MGPKYEFTNETRTFDGHVLHRIKRLSDGQLGGWVEKESNLSQEDKCWVAENACVYDKAKVCHEAIVSGNAKVFDKAEISGYAKVYDDAQVYGESWVYGSAKVYDNAQIYDKAWIYDNAEVYNNAKIYDNANVWNQTKVYGNAKIYGEARIHKNAQVYENVEVYDISWVGDNAKVYGNAKVFDHACVGDNARVYGNAILCNEARVFGTAEVGGSAKICGDTEVSDDAKIFDNVNNEDSVVQDFIYKINDSNKLVAQTEYDSIEEFFSEPAGDDLKLDTLVICTVDTKETLVKLQKINVKDKTEFKFIVDVTNEDGDNFSYKSTIKSQEHLAQLVEQTVEALRIYPQLSKYADDLENCL